MTVEVYIGRHFEHGHERRALGLFLQDLKKRFEGSDTHYIVVTEIDANGAALDLLLLSNRTIILADLKELTAAKQEDAESIQIEGQTNGIWHYSIPSQDRKIPLGGSSNKGKNPYTQMERMRHDFADWLVEKIPSITGKKLDHKTCLDHINSLVVLSPGFDENLEQLDLPWEEINSHHNWFRVIPLSQLAWEFHCTTDLHFELTTRELHALVNKLGGTKVENWGEILPEHFPSELPPLPKTFLFSRIAEMGELVGRSKQIEDLMLWISKDSTAIIAITGAGGTGKTSILGHLVKQTSNLGWQIKYISCREKQFTIETFLAAIASEVEDRAKARIIISQDVDQIDRLDNCLDYLESQKTILMIDDYQKINPADEINRILVRVRPRSRNLKAIIASREHPKVIDDPSLPFITWEELTLYGLEKEDLPLLFNETQRGKLTKRNFDWIWDRTSGNPYAIGLLKPLIRNGWSERIKDLPLYQNDKAAWFDSLLETLDKESRQLAFRLSVIQTGITNDLIKHILHDPKRASELTNDLIDKFIIQKVGIEDKYVMHDFLREYLYDHFIDPTQKMKTHLDAGNFYKHGAELCPDEFQAGDYFFEAVYHFELASQDNLILELSELAFEPLKMHGDLDRANIIAQKALKAARAKNKLIEISRWLVHIAAWKIDRDQIKEASGLLQQAFNQLPKIDSKIKTEDKRSIQEITSSISIEKGRIAYGICEYDRSKEHFTNALKVIEEIGNQELHAECLLRIARIERQRGDLETSQIFLEKAKEIAEDNGFNSFLIQALSHLALIARQKNDFKTAQQLFSDAYLLAEETGDWKGYETNCSLLGDLDRRQGNYSAAIEKFSTCLESSRKVGSGIAIRINLGQLAESLIRSGRLDEAKPLLEEVEERCDIAGDGVGIAWTKYRKGLFIKKSGDAKAGDELIHQAIDKLREIGSEVYIKDFMADLGPTQESLPGLQLG